jgi:hypothetical protein
LSDGVFELRHADWSALSARLVIANGQLRYPMTDRPPRAELHRVLTVAPALSVNVQLVREGDTFVWWLEHEDGSFADGREVVLTIDGVATRTRSRGRQRLDARQVSVVDVQSRVCAAGVAP